MGVKTKREKSEEEVQRYLTGIYEIVAPILGQGISLELLNLDQQRHLAVWLAFLMNNKFYNCEEKYYRSFGADDIIPLKILVFQKDIIKYWGKIYWLSTPNNHECFRDYQDPFYGAFKISNQQLEIIEILFGDYAKTDLEDITWVNRIDDIEWMHEL